MTTASKIVKNTSVLISSQIFSKLINVCLLLILTRMLGIEGFGLYSFGFAYVTIFIVLMHLGLNNLMVREVAKDKDGTADYVETTLPVTIILSFITVFLINAFALIFSWPLIERTIIFIFSIYVLFDAASRFLLAVIRAHERMEFEGIVTVLERSTLLLVSLLVWYLNAGLITLLIYFCIVQVLKMLTALFLVRRYFAKFRLKFISRKALPLLREAYPFALVGLFGTWSTRIDSVMLKIFHNPEMVGVFNAARKLTESLTFIPENIYLAVFPAISILYVKNTEKFNLTFQYTLRILLIIALPLMAGLTLLAPQIINLLFEAEYREAYIALRLLSIALGALFLKHAFALILNATGKQHLFSIFTGIAMLLNVTLNYLLIPTYNIFGASLATVISEWMTAILMFFAIRNFVSISSFSNKLIRIIFCGILNFLFIYVIRDLNLFVVVLATILFYTLSLIIFRVITKEDIKYFRTLFNLKLSKG